MFLSEQSATFYPEPLRGEDMKNASLIRTLGRLMAKQVEKLVPPGPDRTLAIRHLEDAVMRSTKGIAEARKLENALEKAGA